MTTVLDRPSLSWQDVVVSFAPLGRREAVRAQLGRMWLPLILLAQAIATWRLSDIVFDDEALYLLGGRAIVQHYLHGTPLPQNYGAYFSGAPNIYPVFSGMLDAVGGLDLARLASVVFMLGATLCVNRIGRELFDRRIGLLSAAVFAFSGSVLFDGKLATYDPPCVFLVSLALMIALTRRSVVSGLLVGAVLAAAVATKYTGIAFVPFIVGLTFIHSLADQRRSRFETFLRALVRGLLAAFAVEFLLMEGYHLWGGGIKAGVAYTTTARKALDASPRIHLLKELIWDIGIIFVLALGAAAGMVRQRHWYKATVFVTFLVAGVTLQVAQMKINEYVSLNKHTAFSALFLCIPAAVAFDWALRRRYLIAVVLVAWLLLIDGLWRSDMQYSWPASVMKPIAKIQQFDFPGVYWSLDSDTAAFYLNTKRVRWVPSSVANSDFSLGDTVMEGIEKGHKFTGFMFQTYNGTGLAPGFAYLSVLLSLDKYYTEVGTYRVTPYVKAEWQLWIHFPPPKT